MKPLHRWHPLPDVLRHIAVRNHVISIIDNLEVSDRTEAATAAIQRGIISVAI